MSEIEKRASNEPYNARAGTGATKKLAIEE